MYMALTLELSSAGAVRAQDGGDVGGFTGEVPTNDYSYADAGTSNAGTTGG